MTDLLVLQVGLLAAVVGWLVLGRAPAILHAPLSAGCALLNGVGVLAGMSILWNARTPVEQVTGCVAVGLFAAQAAGAYVHATRTTAPFREVAPAAEPARQGAVKTARAKRARSKPRRPTPR